MIPVRLHLSGFLSYKDPVDVDFTGFDLACISGSNGAGKSSLLDAMTWALFGQARRRDDALINSHAQAAEVALDFRYENNLYRIQRAKPRDKTTVLEFFVCGDDGAWRALTEKSLRETEKRIENILRMDYDTFTNASFLLQGRADQFAQQRPGDRKKVLSAILGLEVWESYRQDAAERRKGVESDIHSLEAQIEDIDHELSEEDSRKERLQKAEASLKQISELRKAQESNLDSLRSLAASVGESRKLVDMLEKTARDSRQRIVRLRADLDALIEERARYRETLAGEAEAKAAYQRWQELRLELERWDSVAANFREIEARRAAPMSAITAEASRLDQERRTLYAQEISFQQEQNQLPELEKQRADLSATIEQLEKELANRAALENDLQTLQSSVAESQVENRSLKDAMRALKERIDRLQQVSGAVCPLCGQPLSAEERANLVSSLEIEGKEMGDRYRANLELQNQSEGRLRDLQAKIAGLGRYADELRGYARQHDRIEAECQRIAKAGETWRAGGAARLAEITRMLAEEDFATDARAELAVIDAESRALGYDAAAHDAVRRAEIEGRGSEMAIRELETARASLAPLERQINGLEQQLAQESAQLARQEQDYQAAKDTYEAQAAKLPDLNAVEAEVFTIQAEENRLRMDVGMIRQSVAVLDVQREKRARFANQRDQMQVQVSRLKMLERAFSKDGVPALLIEQALPEIETQANELLDRLSGGAMSVRFETQRQYKDKNRDDRRETLDIIISDASGPREYELFSGGEAFRVNFAIRLALSRVLAKRAGARLQTLVIDEGFGSQDIEGRQRLIEAINLVRDDFQKILVITHLEELKEAFPARIEVEKTLRGSRVTVVN
jgi:exonuclease SbcC